MDWSQVQRNGPFTRLPKLAMRTIAIEDVRPLIRIAHCREVGDVAERIIFDHELVLIRRGHCTFTRGGESIDAGPGTLLFIRPFVPHAFSPMKGGNEHLAVHFDFTRDALPGGSDPHRRRPYGIRLSGGLSIPAVRHCEPGDIVSEAFLELVRAREQNDPRSQIIETACLLRMLGHLLQSPKTPSKQRDSTRVQRAVAYLHQHLAEPLDLDQLAEVSDLSRSHLTRLFRHHTGHTPMTYLRRARVEHARQLLADVDLSIKQIARRCGFDDAYHFSRVFRQIDGLSPTLYREAALAGRST